MSLRWSESEFDDYQQRQAALDQCGAKHGLTPKQGKYRNRPVTVNGIRFDSKLEAARWGQLQMMERAGKITDLCRQVVFELAPAVVLQGKKKRALTYRADFTYKQDGRFVVEDSKGVRTKEYIIKAHLFKHVHGLDITEV